MRLTREWSCHRRRCQLAGECFHQGTGIAWVAVQKDLAVGRGERRPEEEDLDPERHPAGRWGIDRIRKTWR